MNQWISVKDRLPEDKGDVLVLKHNGLRLIMSYHQGFDAGKREFWWWSFGKWLNQHSQVTHWMPLPDKPGATQITEPAGAYE